MKIMKHSCIVWMWLKVDDPKNGWSSSCSKHQIIVPQRVEPDFQDGIDDVPQKFPTQLSAFSRQVHSNALCHTDIYTCLGQWQPPGGSEVVDLTSHCEVNLLAHIPTCTYSLNVYHSYFESHLTPLIELDDGKIYRNPPIFEVKTMVSG